MTKRYGVWCQVSGGITGYRHGWLKREDGTRKEFNSLIVAACEATRLNSEPKRVRRALFAYQVLEITGEQDG